MFNISINQPELEVKTGNLLEASKNASYQVGISSSFKSDWLIESVARVI